MADGDTEAGQVIEQEHEHGPASTEGELVGQKPTIAPRSDPEAVAVEVPQRGKMVPLEVLKKEQGSLRTVSEKLTASEKALEQHKQFYQQAQPILQRIQADPALLDAVKAGKLPDPTPPQAEGDDPVLVDLAKSLDLFDARGKPDVGRAHVISGYMESIAEAKAKALTEPLAAQTAKGQAQINYERLKDIKLPDGSTVDPQIFDFWRNAIGDEYMQNTETARTALMQAIGHQVLTGKPFVKPAGPALVTDASGGRRTRNMKLTDNQVQIAKEMGVGSEVFQAGVKHVMDNDGVLEEVD